ncbi:rab proteins geranylgeranyltransferase component A-like [Convolutriloba macropyga]|uniref:rab proteins geranylgeranyltransferase component A-like n=1 Tax=Convolutriloba macropyga TaxID=536237 RepID=UPI003F51BA9B
MSEEFPTECDVLVLGTGLVESIVGAACSRIGRKVVTLDRNSFYGGDWATFSVRNLREWLAAQTVSEINSDLTKLVSLSLGTEDVAFDIPQLTAPNISHIDYWCYSNDADGAITDDVSKMDDTDSNGSEPKANELRESKLKLIDDLDKYGNRFNISLCSKILIAKGKMVKLLVDSATSRYCEFLALHDLNFLYNTKIEKVPSSRADVFKNNLISLVEKRQMMRVLEFCMNDTAEVTEEELLMCFTDYLQNVHSVSERLSNIILLHVLYEASDATTKKCLEKLRLFCGSLGVYSNSPYLFTMYGVGELPQCFSRMNAIFGGIFILGSEEAPHKLLVTNGTSQEHSLSNSREEQAATDDQMDEDRAKSIVRGVVTASGRIVKCRYLVASSSYVPTSMLPTFVTMKRSYIRAIFVTNRRLDPTKDASVVLVSIAPPKGREHPLRIIEETSQACSTSESFYLLQATTEDEDPLLSPREQFDLYLSGLIQPYSIDENPDVPEYLLSLYFRYTFLETRSPSHKDGQFDNLFVTSGPDSDLEFDHCVEQAESIFRQICPSEEFLPRAPDPGDVIIGEPNEVANDNLMKEPQDCEIPVENDGDVSNSQKSAEAECAMETENHKHEIVEEISNE